VQAMWQEHPRSQNDHLRRGICRLSQRRIPSPHSLSQARNGTLSQVRSHAGGVPSRGVLHGALPQVRGKACFLRMQDPGRRGREGDGRAIPVCAVSTVRPTSS
jgi:hypothetical protein